MDIRNLNTFIQVAESGSFTKAGELLGYSQPTISVQIRQLEQELGVKLFDRIGHTVRLTEKGHEALIHAQQICQMCRELVRRSSYGDEPQGLIRLATADSLCAPLFDRALADFRGKYPRISLKVMTAGTDEMFRMLDHNEADLVCTLDSRIYNANYRIATEERVGVHFVVAAQHPLARMEELSVETLLDFPFLLTEKGMSYRRLLEEELAKRSLEVHPVLEMGRADILCHLVSQGMGVSFLPDYVTAEAVRQGQVARLNVPGFAPELWKQLLYHRDKWISPQMEAVIRCLNHILLA